MEIASARVIQPHLAPGQLSVGVTIDVSHTAATPLGAQVEAQATYTGSEGKLLVFDVMAKDDGGVVGKAVHKRAVIDKQRIELGAEKRVASINRERLC